MARITKIHKLQLVEGMAEEFNSDNWSVSLGEAGVTFKTKAHIQLERYRTPMRTITFPWANVARYEVQVFKRESPSNLIAPEQVNPELTVVSNGE